MKKNGNHKAKSEKFEFLPIFVLIVLPCMLAAGIVCCLVKAGLI